MIAYNPHIKRFIDVVFSLLALICLFPFLVIMSLLICIESKGSPFFVQERLGKGMHPFRLIKFRSMRRVEQSTTPQFEPGRKSRITIIGRFLRDTKLDELPELLNVLKGDMSIVGPRPEVPQYVQLYPDDFRAILHVRPGLSDYASMTYRNEEEILAGVPDPDEYYLLTILPDKLKLAKQYIKDISWKADWTIILETIKRILY